MSETGQELQTRALAQLDSIWDSAKLDEWRIEFIGRKGAVNALFEQIGSIPKEERGTDRRAGLSGAKMTAGTV